MPKKICPICGNGYARYIRRIVAFGRVIEKQYECTNCGKVSWEPNMNKWSKGWSVIETVKD